MLVSGGPYQKNVEMVAKMRDMAAIVNRIQLGKNVQKLNSEVRWLSEAKFQADAAQYASPPMHRRPKEREGRADILTPEHDVSPTITGLHDRNKRQRHRMRTPGSTGAGMGGYRASGYSVGAHKT